MHALISANVEQGRLLARTIDELVVHAGRFVVAVRGRRIVGCAELAPLSPDVAEIRSLVVDAEHRRTGVGAAMLDQLRRRARLGHFTRLCAFTHAPAYFVRLGFSIVAHATLPEKIRADCATCARFRRCGQVALVSALEPADEAADRAWTPRHTAPGESSTHVSSFLPVLRHLS